MTKRNKKTLGTLLSMLVVLSMVFSWVPVTAGTLEENSPPAVEQTPGEPLLEAEEELPVVVEIPAGEETLEDGGEADDADTPFPEETAQPGDDGSSDTPGPSGINGLAPASLQLGMPAAAPPAGYTVAEVSTAAAFEEALLLAVQNAQDTEVQLNPAAGTSWDMGVITLALQDPTLENVRLRIVLHDDYAGGSITLRAAASRHFHIASANISLSFGDGVLLDGAGTGGGMLVEGAATNIENATLQNCVSMGDGGAIYVADGAALTLESSTITANHAANNGGGIYVGKALLWLNGCTLADNSAGMYGGGLFVEGEGPSYTITYHDAYVGATFSDAVTQGQSYTLLGEAGTGFSRPNYRLDGWATAPGASAKVYEAGQVLTPVADMNLYAVWVYDGPATIDVLYDNNGGTGGNAQGRYIDPATGGAPYTVLSDSLVGFAKHANTFIEWNTQADGSGTAYVPGDIVALDNGTLVLYAQWEYSGPTSFDILYDSNGGLGGTYPDTAPANQPYTILSGADVGFTRYNYELAFWTTGPGGTGNFYYPGDVVTITENLILYAFWIPMTQPQYVSITYHPGEGEGTPYTDWVQVSGSAPYSTNALGNEDANLQFDKPGEIFVRWNTEAAGTGSDYYPGNPISFNSSPWHVDLYAQWEQPLAEVVYHSNNSQGLSDITMETVGNVHEVKSPASLGFVEDTGKVFSHWEDINNEVFHPDEQKLITGDTHFFAVWEDVQQSPPPWINYMADGADTVTGTGVPNATVTVFMPNGSAVTVMVAHDGTWTAPYLGTLRAGDMVYATQELPNALVSDQTQRAVGQMDSPPLPIPSPTLPATGTASLPTTSAAPVGAPVNDTGLRSVFIAGGSITGNSAGQDGGGIYTRWYQNLVATGVSFGGNTAGNGARMLTTTHPAFAQLQLIHAANVTGTLSLSGSFTPGTHYAYNNIDINLAAAPAAYTVTYTPGTGSGTAQSFAVTGGTAHTLLSETALGFRKTGHSFTGWKQADGTLHSTGTALTVNGNITLEAQWELIATTSSSSDGGTTSSSGSGSSDGGTSSTPPPVVTSSSSTPSGSSSRSRSSSSSAPSSSSSSTPSSSSSPDGSSSSAPPDSSTPDTTTPPTSSTLAGGSGGGSGSTPTREELIDETGSVNLFGNEIPRGNLSLGSAWSLLSLLLALLSLFAAVILGILAAVKRKNQSGAKADSEQGANPRNTRGLRIVAALCGLLPMLCFLVLENLQGTMVLLSRWTVCIGLLFTAQMVLTVIALLRGRNSTGVPIEGDEDEYEE